VNIFDILSAGKRDLNEENISAFLGGLLDPWQSHGMGTLFLERFLNAVDPNLFKPYIELMQGAMDYRESAPLNVTVILENRVIVDSSTRDIDILLIMESSKFGNRFVLIENKIRRGAIDKSQLVEELEDFLNGEYKVTERDVSFVFITATETKAGVEAFKLLPASLSKAYLIWKGKGKTSIERLLMAILQDEANARISPLPADTVQILKGFVHFAQREFRGKSSWGSSASAERSQYFSGVLYGFEQLDELARKEPEVYVGFDGGASKPKSQSLEYLLGRTYKWDNDPERGGKNPKNWLKADEVVKVIRSKKGES
jgi:hypothetical protein